MRGVQRGATIDAHGLGGFLKLMVAGLVILVMIIVFLLLVAAPGGPLLLIILAAAASLAATLLAGSLDAIWAFLLVPPFILGFLLLSEQLNLPVVLEVVAIGAVDLAILLVRAPWLVGNRQGPAGDTSGNFIVGVICLGFLGGAGVVRSLDGKHNFTFALPVAAPAFLRRGGSILI